MQTEIERCFEEMTAFKFEKMAEVKANYDVMMKRFKPDQHADKIEIVKGKKENALGQVSMDNDAEKKAKIAQIKELIEAKKKVIQITKDTRLEKLQTEEKSRRKTVRLNDRNNNSKILLQTSGSSSTNDISANFG